MSHVKALGTAQNPPRLPFRPRNVLLTGLAMLTASLLVGCGTASEPTGDNVDDVHPSDGQQVGGTAGSNNVPSTTGGGLGDSSLKAVENYVDNHNGVQVFGDSGFSAFTNHGATGYRASHIPYGTKVNVMCYVHNNTGQYSSVNGLYHIKGGPWDGGWVPANVMLNSSTAKVGDTNTPDRDPRVPDCA